MPRQWLITVLFVLLLGIALLLGGCNTPQVRPAKPAATATPEQPQVEFAALDLEAQQTPDPPPALNEDDEDRPIWSRLRQGFRLGHIEHPRIQRQIQILKRSPNDFVALMARAEPYLHHILNKIENAGLPSELALLPAIESGFRPHVYSPEGAAGLWQFMPLTGRMMGLKQDWWFDKRRTVEASTDAAIRYLDKLNARFEGDWLHTLASYNAGASKVSRAMRRARRRGDSTEFWDIDLPGETDVYVPRLLALAAIVSDPDAHGLVLPWITDQPYFRRVDTAGQLDLNVAAELAGMPVDELLSLNAGYRRWATRPDGPHELLLPINRVEAFETRLAALPAEERLRWQRHLIRRGDSLNRIAREYGVSVKAIKRTNGMTHSRIRAGRQLLIPLSDSATLAKAGSNEIAKQRLRYRVRKGDSLYTIARRFEVSIRDLKRWNRVGRYIHPGERLTVFIDPDA